MLIKQILGVSASLITFIAYVPYIVNIFRNKTKPHTFSWFVWSLLTVISFFSQIAGGAGPGAWLMGTTAIICFLVFILGLKKGTKDIQRIDWISFVGALAAMILWIATKTPLLSVILVTITDAFAFLPTIRKSFNRPYEETLIFYFINVAKFILGLLALQKFSVITALYPLYLLFANGFFVIFLYIRRKQVARV